MIEMTNTWMEKGIERGLEQGLAQGVQRGLEQGLAQGRIAERQEIAKRLIATGLSEEAVSEATGLTLEEVQKLK